MSAVELVTEKVQVSRQNQIRVMVMEYSTTEAHELIEPLRAAGYAITASRVKSVLEFQVCLKKQDWDLILSSVSLSEFGPLQALALLKHARRDIPMIVVASIGIEQKEVVDLMQAGARDVVPRDQSERMITVIQRELGDLGQRRARQHFEVLYRDTERRSMMLMQHLSLATAYIQGDTILVANPRWRDIVGGEIGKPGELRNLLNAIPAETRTQVSAILQRTQSGTDTDGTLTTSIKNTQGSEREYTLEFSAASLGEIPCTQVLLLNPSASKSASVTAIVTPLTSAIAKSAKEVSAELAERDAAMRRRIEAALTTNRFRLMYQPIVNLHAEVHENYEVLVRMLDENDSEVMPGEFIPVAEQSNLMTAIDRCVITQALAALAERRKGGKETSFFIKLAEDSLQDPSLAHWIHAQLQATGLPENSVVFEIKELSAVGLLDNTRDLIAALKSMHCRVALDHFGNHPQSLDHLEQLSVDFIKLAGSFMDKLAKDPRSEATIKVILQAARSKGIQSVATCVQDATNLTTLWQCGLDYIQGYFLQRPDTLLSYDFSG